MTPEHATRQDTTCVRVSAFGVVVPLEISGEALARAVVEAWRDALTEESPTVAPVVVIGDDIQRALHDLSPAVTTAAINARAGDLVMLHAAALADPSSGRTAVLVAASGTGKTTASAKLGTRLAYLSDETAGITSAGMVLPYRKPLSILDGGPLKRQVAPSALGLASTELDCRLGALVVLERDPAHIGTPVVELLETVDAIAAIAPQSSFLPSMERPLHRLAELIHLVGGAHRVTYSESAALEAVLVELLGVAP